MGSIKNVFMKKMMLLLFISLIFLRASAQDMTELINKVKTKLDQVNDYVAEGTLKTDVSFIKAPAGKVKMYFKKPDRFKLKKDGGISILPKGGVSVSMNYIIKTSDYVALAAGESTVDNTKTKIVKLLPTDENSEIVLSTLYIDETNLLIRKAVTTTKENGTYEVNMSYGKYSSYALPDKVVFSFNTKDYKLPKGVTLEFSDDEKPSDLDKLKNKKGKVEITYSSYTINKGVDDSVFK
jgi:outer membrane lipoprotein-sorting protein